MSEIARLARWPATHVDPAAVALRAVLLASGISAWLFTSLASHRLAGGMGFVIVALTARCARYPDGHAGLLVVAAVTIDWLATVHDHATPWSMATAAALALLHSTAAAASVAPTGASWTVAMRRRWARRSLLLVATGAVAWLVVAVAHRSRAGGRPVVVVVALVVVSLGGLWLRFGTDMGPAPEA